MGHEDRAKILFRMAELMDECGTVLRTYCTQATSTTSSQPQPHFHS